MAHTDSVGYHLPLSCVRVTATVAETTDAIVPGKPQRSPEATVTLDVIGDEAPLTATITSGWVRDTNVAFKLTDDGRLVSSAVESSGELGKIVVGAVGVAATVGGVLLGMPGAGALALAPLSAVKGIPGLAEGEAAEEYEPKADPVATAYEAVVPGALALRRAYARDGIELERLSEVAVAALTKATDAAGRKEALDRLASYRRGSAGVRSELERLDAHFRTWRATTFKTRLEHHERLLTFDEIREARAVGGGLVIAFAPRAVASPTAEAEAFAAAARKKVRRLWNDFGVLIAIDDFGDKVTSSFHTEEDEILVRVPRRVQLSLYKRDGERPVLAETMPCLIMDDACEVRSVHFRKSLWAKRGEEVSFSPSGALSGLASTRTAAGAAVAEAAAGVPGAVSSGLDQSMKLLAGVEALRTLQIDQQLARLKRRIEVKQQEIVAAGLLATEGSAAELARLTQEAELLERRRALAGYAGQSDAVVAEVAALRQQIELLTARQELSDARASLSD